MSLEVLPVRGVPEVRAGEDLARLLVEGLRSSEIALRDLDVVVVTQKVVSKAEGRVVRVGPEGKASWIARETRRVVARRGDLVIAETRHGFVCANAGVDESNVEPGFVSLLPEDPDGSAERLRVRMQEATGADMGVIVTDTFGRAWREGLVDVAIGCAGIGALTDLRGTKDSLGRTLEATVLAVADQIAAAAGLVTAKAERVPAAVVRGAPVELRKGSGRELVRPREQDLFPYSPVGDPREP